MMKPFMGIDVTILKKNEEFDGAEWLEMAPSAALSQSIDQATDRMLETVEESELPLILRIIRGICGFVALFVAVVLIKSLIGEDSIPLAQAYQNVAWLFWAGGICLVIWLTLFIMSIKQQKEVFGSEEGRQAFSNVDGTVTAVFTELGVPEDARDVDVLSFYYKDKDGKIKAVEKAMAFSTYTTMPFQLFYDEEKIYLANMDGKYAFPRTSLRFIETVKKTVSADCWNKEEDFNKGQYKQYKITTDKYDTIYFKPYHILHLDRDGEEWGIYFPCYELPAFEAATGLKAQEI